MKRHAVANKLQPKRARPGRKRRRLKVGWTGTAKYRVPIPNEEKQRLAALRSYQILDTAPEANFDNITTLAALICGTPIALLSLVDSDRQWFKAKVGVSVCETSRDLAFCAHAIMYRDLFIVEDAAADKRFSSNPLVTSEPKIRFYAGAPLVTPNNLVLGALCVIDRVPRKLTDEQTEALRALSRQVMAELELRRTVRELKRKLMEQRLAGRNLEKALRAAEASHRSQKRLLRRIVS